MKRHILSLIFTSVFFTGMNAQADSCGGNYMFCSEIVFDNLGETQITDIINHVQSHRGDFQCQEHKCDYVLRPCSTGKTAAEYEEIALQEQNRCETLGGVYKRGMGSPR